jgi:hypothetical protein
VRSASGGCLAALRRLSICCEHVGEPWRAFVNETLELRPTAATRPTIHRRGSRLQAALPYHVEFWTRLPTPSLSANSSR